MSRRKLRIYCLYALTGLAWLVLVIAALPLPIHLEEDTTRLACAIALTGSFVAVKLRLNRGADELFRAGKMVGRAQCMAENCGPDGQVVTLDELRARRAAGRGVGDGVRVEDHPM